MKAASEVARRVTGATDGSTRVWLSRAAWVPLVAVLVLTAGWVGLTVTGHRTLVVMSGSMEPVLHTGDVIVVDVIEPGEARPLDIVSFRDPSRANQLVTHRVVAMGQVGDHLGFLTKGDANTGTEQWDVGADGTIGRLSFKIPALGRLIVWLGRPGVRALLLGLAFLVLGGMAMKFIWGLRNPTGHPIALAGIALLALAAGSVALPPTMSAFSSSTSNPGNAFAAGPTFGCTDPGIRTVTATADSWVEQATPGANYGSSAALYARSETSNTNKRTLVSFDLPAPGGCYVTGAWLGMYASVSSSTTRTMEARRIAAPWTEGSVTWVNQPATTGTPATRTNALGWNYWDVKSMVQSMYAGSNYGILIKDAAEGAATSAEQIYNSREQATLRPTLYISMAVNSTCTFPFGATVNRKQASRDAWIDQAVPDTNHGNELDLYVQSNAGAAGRSLVMFDDLPTISSGCALFSATISMYAKSSTGGPRTLQMWPLAANWTENQVKWNTQPAMTGVPTTAQSGAGWVTWDVTQVAQAWYAGTNHGVLIKDAAEGSGTSTQIFSSRSDTPNGPELYVRWG
jgi:signal peptidase I